MLLNAIPTILLLKAHVWGADRQFFVNTFVTRTSNCVLRTDPFVLALWLINGPHTTDRGPAEARFALKVAFVERVCAG